MPFQIIRDDITHVKADAIVNTANPHPTCGAGTDEAIYNAAGKEKLLAERKKIGELVPGDVAVTKAFALQAKYIIHTVGPVWYDGTKGELETLKMCYERCLRAAEKRHCRSIAFPLISTGVYCFPKDQALEIAVGVISDYVLEHDMEVILVVYDRNAFELSEQRYHDVEAFIDENYVEEHRPLYRSPRDERSAGYARRMKREWELERRTLTENASICSELPCMETDNVPDGDMPNLADEPGECAAPRFFETQAQASLSMAPMPQAAPVSASKSAPKQRRAGKAGQPVEAQLPLDELLQHTGETFQQRLFHYIDEKGYEDKEVYTRANIDRKHFSKIRSNKDYSPTKKTVLALAVALNLTLDQTEDLLSRAGFAFSPSSKGDLIVKYYITQEQYNIFFINAVLFKYQQELLGNVKT